LNNVQAGDKISLRYKGIVYEYSVIERFEVGSREVWIENNYSFPTITLYTCTPIYNPVRRLVILGKLVSIN
jgi:sortase (surface protein transpeptidase)